VHAAAPFCIQFRLKTTKNNRKKAGKFHKGVKMTEKCQNIFLNCNKMTEKRQNTLQKASGTPKNPEFFDTFI